MTKNIRVAPAKRVLQAYISGLITLEATSMTLIVDASFLHVHESILAKRLPEIQQKGAYILVWQGLCWPQEDWGLRIADCACPNGCGW
jgi:hypothetical protein